MGKTNSVTPVSDQSHRPLEVRISTHLVVINCTYLGYQLR